MKLFMEGLSLLYCVILTCYWSESRSLARKMGQTLGAGLANPYFLTRSSNPILCLPAKQPHFRFGSLEGRVHGLGRMTKDVSLRRLAFLIQAALFARRSRNWPLRSKDWPPKVTGVRSILALKVFPREAGLASADDLRRLASCNSLVVGRWTHDG